MPIKDNKAIDRVTTKPVENLNRLIPRFKNVVRRRLFYRGKNSADRQMARAKKPKTNLYRYDTGEFFKSLEMKRIDDKTLEMQFTRDAVVLESLTERYGLMTDFSKGDVSEINDIIVEELEKDRTLIDRITDGIKNIFKRKK